MLRIRQSFTNLRITKKLMLMYIGAIVVPVLLISSVFLWHLSGIIEERETVTKEAAIDRVHSQVVSALDEMNKIAILYAADRELHKMISEYNPSTDYDMFSDIRAIENRLDILTWPFPRISYVTLYQELDREDRSDLLKYLSDEVRETEWFKTYESSGENFMFDLEVVNNRVYLIGISDYATYSTYIDNILYQGMRSTDLSQVFADEYFTEESSIYLVNDSGQVIAGSKNPYWNSADIISIDDLSFKNPELLVTLPVEVESLTEGWQLIFYMDQSAAGDRLSNSIDLFLLTTGFVLFLSVFLVAIISVSFSRRLGHVASVMKNSQTGELVMAETDDSLDEIGVVVRSYNRLITRITELLSQIRKEKEVSDRLLSEKISAYEELETTHEELASVNQELTASFEEIKIQDIRIKELIYSDLLTGLNNRFSITNIIEKGIKDIHGELAAVIFMDVDNFKYINDTYGHDIGDLVIKETGSILKSLASGKLDVGRFGGDEFLIFATGYPNKMGIIQLLEKIKGLFKHPLMVEDRKFYLTISMGVSIFPGHGADRNELIKKADMALYRSKDSGKNRYTFYNREYDEGLERRLVLQNAIKEATENKEFYLNYQPYFSAESGALKGYEALIRWDPPGIDRVSPYELVTVAEGMGSIVEIGDWIIEEAMHFIKDVNNGREELLTISINISALQLISKDFNERLLGVAKAVGVTPEEICLEMTETVLIDSYTRQGDELRQLYNMGFGIALDDFGTGYSSLSYFRELPVTVLKIDKSFVDEIVDSTFSKDLIKVMTMIAHSRSVSITAEGVEMREQLEILKELGCDTIQGYYFSKPLSRDLALEKSLDKG